MKKLNWEQVDENAGNGHNVPTGVYVLKVVDVIEEDDFITKKGEPKPRIGIVWDIAEGELAGTFSDEWAMKNSWVCTHWFFYENNPGYFKKFFMTLEKDNPGFAFDDERVTKMIGKKFVAAVRHNYYTWDGQDKDRIEIASIHTMEEFKNNKVRFPQDRDNREYKGDPMKQSTAAYNNVNIPF